LDEKVKMWISFSPTLLSQIDYILMDPGTHATNNLSRKKSNIAIEINNMAHTHKINSYL
jgi:hypothetical protein